MLRDKLIQALTHDAFLSEDAAQEAAFHLADWLEELRDLCELYSAKRWDAGYAQGVLLRFVAHAPGHVAASHKLLLGLPVTDIFNIGAVKGTGRVARKPRPPSRRAG